MSAGLDGGGDRCPGFVLCGCSVPRSGCRVSERASERAIGTLEYPIGVIYMFCEGCKRVVMCGNWLSTALPLESLKKMEKIWKNIKSPYGSYESVKSLPS